MLKELGLVCRGTEYSLVGKVSFRFPPPHFGVGVAQPVTSSWSTELNGPGPSPAEGLFLSAGHSGNSCLTMSSNFPCMGAVSLTSVTVYKFLLKCETIGAFPVAHES